MESTFDEACKTLNSAQKRAVEAIDGPLLVIAGPGTGKTQLLSVRVARILKLTDTPAENILCLTFTENGALNMRERLSLFVGQDAYRVNISTYHALGGELIREYPEYFGETRLQNPVDELGKRDIIAKIVEKMSYQNPLKQTRHHLGDLVSTISDSKRALLTSGRLRMLAEETEEYLQTINQQLPYIFEGFVKIPRKLEDALVYFKSCLELLQTKLSNIKADEQFGSLGQLAADELQTAMRLAHETGKTTPLTQWKNSWLAKNADNQFILEGELQNKRLLALADVLEKYQAALEARGLYDFDDMIIRSIAALEAHPDLKYTLQEKYLYILLDEFQDTNAAQFRLVQLLTDNQVHEGRPNVLAVGDDDQAIYAFQGAHYSNMIDFYRSYRETTVINLTENYRSHADILHTAHQVASQIETRLEQHFSEMSKLLSSANLSLPKKARIERHDFMSNLAEYDWIAEQIEQKIAEGVKPSEIAVLAPRHRYLEPLVPYLNSRGITVSYEKRENILETLVVKQLLQMSRLVLALQRDDQDTADSLWPEVLSYSFWEYETTDIWRLSWKINDNPKKPHWSQVLLDDDGFQRAAQLFLILARKAASETCETMLDYLIGSLPVKLVPKPPHNYVLEEQSNVLVSQPPYNDASEQPSNVLVSQPPYNESSESIVLSPLRAFYSSPEKRADEPDIFYETLSHLTVIREKLREYEQSTGRTLILKDFLDFVDLYEAAEERMINTSPYNQSAEAVQLMTVFKAKGLEFEHVFLPCCNDEVWGESARTNSNKLTLPAHLAPIRHAGANRDERLRIFFVAITRAKTGLYLSSYRRNYAGKTTKRLAYLDEQEQSDGTHISAVLPPHHRTVHSDDKEIPSLMVLEQNWHMRHLEGIGQSQLRSLLSDRLARYRLSPTHLNTFIDLVYSGPEAFFCKVILRFPSAPTAAGQFGNAIHETLEWLQHQIDNGCGGGNGASGNGGGSVNCGNGASTGAGDVSGGVKDDDCEGGVSVGDRDDGVGVNIGGTGDGGNGRGKMPSLADIKKYYRKKLAGKKLAAEEAPLLIERGEHALTTYLAQQGATWKAGNKAEFNFINEGVLVGEAHLSGKIDRIDIDVKNRTATIVDYKTGKSFSKWTSDIKLHKFKQQLYCYKMLIEGSRSFMGYTVAGARLEFIEPDATGKICTLELEFNDKEMEHTKKLIQAMWQRVQTLNLPDVTGYATTLAAVRQFEQDLIAEL